jgi:hypothetical protein
MELLEELPEPTSFSHAVGHGMILSLGARPGMMFWRLKDQYTRLPPRNTA